MKTLITTAPFILSLSTIQALAVCPGFTFAIGNVIPQGGGNDRWNIYDNSCNIVDGLTTNENPCTKPIFGCSPPPILFVNYTSTVTGARYACRQDPNSGVCGNNIISVCCLPSGASPSSSTTQLLPSTSTEAVSVSALHPLTISTASTPSNPSATQSSSVSPPSVTITQASPFIPPNITRQTTSSPSLSTASAAATINESSTLSSGAIAGISIGCVTAMILIAVLALFCYKERERTRNRGILFPGPGSYFGDPLQPGFTTLPPSFQAHNRSNQISAASYHSAWQGSSAPVAPTLLTLSTRSTSVWTSSDEKSQSPTSERTSTDAEPLPYLLPAHSGRLPPPYDNRWSEKGSYQ